ncbi:LOB domain-containing protein 2-like protein [Cinnamomum micranthum f. kanehirae]|uniref:LOB domain-containing protein 2-like protein n=1 Tax=Cinnamomum micranthum f. kanehirae TaxID=337451 RepID=A0A443Q085_9MAGN|nr:LOB domain-containing protein 2-like protein [Cinnamomum micranthum f. kanehirae]
MEKERSMAAKKEETQQACASCKHQRKKCKREICPLAPFFPAERTREFEAVQKVFGVSNAQKMIQAVDTREEQFIVAESLIWEAICRLRDPKHGCSADYKRLQAEKNKLQLLVHSLEKQNQELLRLQISKNMQCFHNNVPQQNQSLMKITYDNFNYIESGLIGTSNNDLINRIDFGSLAHSSIQHNEDYSFTDQLYTPMKTNVELMNQFNEAKIDSSGHVEPNAINMDNIMSSLCGTSWQEAP